jgi:DMSO/TMAO reductase YedYZ molybdopterin-dependent catalytic subunit
VITRRTLITTGLITGGGALAVVGANAIGGSATTQSILGVADDTHKFLQRSIRSRDALAREFRPEQMSPKFRVNGNATADGPEYAAHVASKFANWKLVVDGLVQRPLSISLAQLQAMPQRAQITRHDCVEGWSAIGKWQGPLLSTILQAAGLRDTARFIVFHCADGPAGNNYYESIDLIDAFHPQTILAWAMNDRRLEIGHGAPIRLRVERQLGYKQAKFVMRIEAVESFAAIGQGKGGFWEDRSGYEWYAGI